MECELTSAVGISHYATCDLAAGARALAVNASAEIRHRFESLAAFPWKVEWVVESLDDRLVLGSKKEKQVTDEKVVTGRITKFLWSSRTKVEGSPTAVLNVGPRSNHPVAAEVQISTSARPMSGGQPEVFSGGGIGHVSLE